MGLHAIRLIALLLLISLPAQAAETRLPIKAAIINLATMPVEEAIAFCDARGMECPAIREKAVKQAAIEQGRPWVSPEGEMVVE